MHILQCDPPDTAYSEIRYMVAKNSVFLITTL